MIGTNDIEESKIFYDSLFDVLGAKPGRIFPNLTGQKRIFYNLDGSSFVISEPIDGKGATIANGSTIGFNVISEEQGYKWHKAGIENGGITIEDPPGVREYDKFSMFLAYLRDPTGHKLCATLLIK
tara:strand:+ start:4650 stop:5027 length:378 start_codon:yes stop_codon:yes gene_type:complete